MLSVISGFPYADIVAAAIGQRLFTNATNAPMLNTVNVVVQNDVYCHLVFFLSAGSCSGNSGPVLSSANFILFLPTGIYQQQQDLLVENGAAPTSLQR
jgi:hypothetical protein